MEIDCVSADESPSPQGSNQDAGGSRRRKEASKGKKGLWKIGRRNKSQPDNTEGYPEGENMAHKRFFQGWSLLNFYHFVVADIS